MPYVDAVAAAISLQMGVNGVDTCPSPDHVGREANQRDAFENLDASSRETEAPRRQLERQIASNEPADD